MTDPVLEVSDLVKEYSGGGGLFRRGVSKVQAVSGVSFAIAAGQTLGLVGESGCGKSSTGRSVVRLVEPTSGSVRLSGVDVLAMGERELRSARRHMQFVFQDPYASLNPRMTAESIIAEPLRVHGRWAKGGPARVRELMEMVGLSPDQSGRYPFSFSGGQRQRIGIARAIALEPSLLVLDEPLSSLDVSIQAGIVNLLEDLQERLGLAYLFIAHDLAMVRHISDDVAIMYLGKIVEIGPVDSIFEAPRHPYTRALLSSVPVPDPRVQRGRKRIVLEGDVPSAIDPPSGCRFRTRCWKAAEICAVEEPPLVVRSGSVEGHQTACHFPEDAPALV